MADSKEIADGGVHARFVFSVIINAQPKQSRPAVFVVRDGKPEMRHHARSLEIGEHDGLAGNRALAVIVRVPVRVVRRRAVGREVVWRRKAIGVGKPRSRFLGGHAGARRA